MACLSSSSSSVARVASNSILDGLGREVGGGNSAAPMGATLAAEALARNLRATSLEKEASFKLSSMGKASQALVEEHSPVKIARLLADKQQPVTN